MDIVFLIARVAFVVLFLASAAGHLTQTQYMTSYAASKGVPVAKASVLVSGVLMAVGALSVLLGVYGDLGALLLALFLVVTAALMQDFWKESDPQAKQMTLIQFNKDVALAGGALAFFLVFSSVEPGLTVTGPLF